jgi:hypothetical protein
MTDVCITDLPGTMQEMAGLIGLEPTLKIMESCGGDRIHVPLQLTLFHPLAELLGHDTAAQLSWYYGGMQLQIPKGSSLKRIQRNRAIWQARKSGSTIRELSARFGLDRRSVFKVLADCKSGFR